MSKYLYQAEALRQLHNTKYYIPINQPLYPQTSAQISDILLELHRKRYISKKQLTYLLPDPANIKARYFYLLPKIHKPQSSWPHPRCPPGRPIVADINTESSRVCEYIDYFLQPLSVLHPSYIKDTYHFVDKIRGQPIEPHWLLITADVESLYTNMKLDLIFESIQKLFLLHPDPTRPDHALLRLLKLTLYNNDFEFNGQFFLQICGIAMGRGYAPASSNIYLRDFDHAAMNDFYIKPLLYSRFLDDIFSVWPGTHSQLLEFQSFLNNLIPGIKVTFTVRHQIIEFLDTYIYKHTDNNGYCTLQTKVYFKPTDTHQLLHRKSFHPQHTFKSIIRSQYIRFKRISSCFLDYQEACAILNQVLISRGYSRPTLLKHKRDIWHNYSPDPNKQDPDNPQIIPVITYFDHHHTKLNREWSSIIRSNPNLKNFRVISAYKKHKNLRNILVNGRFTEEDPEVLLTALAEVLARDTTHSNKPGSIRCTNTKCTACNYITESTHFTSSHNARTFHIHTKLTCNSSNIIYLITCQKCFLQYVGETGRLLKNRINDHLSAIRLNRQTPIGIHFNQPQHSIKHFTALPIEQLTDNNTDTPYLRRKTEAKWQKLLQTKYPFGLNLLKTN